MEKIKYYYSSMSKQIFLIILGLLVLFRFIVFAEVLVFNVNGYAGRFDIGASLILYLVYGLICGFFFVAYKFFFTSFNENEAVYCNKLIGRKVRVDLNTVVKVHLTRKGIYLYDQNGEKACLYIPFFRFGIVSPVGVDEFYKILKQKNIRIEKDFDTLPGQGKHWKWVSIMYTCFALFTLAPATQTLALAVAILKSH